jgi:serine/threonine-protein kinase
MPGLFELVVVGGANAGRALTVDRPITIGSAPNNLVRFIHPKLAAAHAVVEASGEFLRVRHLGPAGTSTLVDGQPITALEVAEGSVITVAGLQLSVRARAAEFTDQQPAYVPPEATKSDTMLRPSGQNPAVRASGQSAAVRTSGVSGGKSDTMLRPSGQNPAVRASGQSAAVRTSGVSGGKSDTMLRPSGQNPAVRASQAGGVRSSARLATPAASLDEVDGPGSEPTAMKRAPVAGQLRDGDVIAGRYRIVSALAAGGMGEVYRAEHVELGKVFALKVMKQELSSDQDFVDRFKREAVASSRIGQHNIVDISDFGRTDEGRFYFVMEFLDGPTLAEVMRRERVLHVSRAVNIGVQIARALGAAHALGIVHRDLKPENVILLKRGSEGDFVKVVDFGVAKVSDGRGQGGQIAFGVVVGTPQYMSPEQAAGTPVDARSDIYSLGLIVYELIAGRVVFEGETPSMVMAAHINQQAPMLEPGLADSFVPGDLQQVIMQMLEKKREARPQTMADVVEVFEAFLGTVARATPATPSVRATDGARGPASGPNRALRASGVPAQRPSGVAAQRVSQAIAPAVVEPVDESPSLVPVPGAKSKLPLIIGGVLALVVVVAGAGFAMSSARGKPVEPAPVEKAPVAVVAPEPPKVKPVEPEPVKAVEPAKPEQVTLTITSEPARAEIDEDGSLVGYTPLKLSVEKGQKRSFSLKKDGYQPETKSVNPSSDLELAIKLTPIRKAATPSKSPGLIDDNPYQ